jgi:hypothetical protein
LAESEIDEKATKAIFAVDDVTVKFCQAEMSVSPVQNACPKNAPVELNAWRNGRFVLSPRPSTGLTFRAAIVTDDCSVSKVALKKPYRSSVAKPNGFPGVKLSIFDGEAALGELSA